eukprot:m51a1_g6685 putative serine threonine kinase (1863) ;mRNA; f:9-31210
MTTQQIRVGTYGATYTFPSFREVAGGWLHVATTYEGNEGGAAVSTLYLGLGIDSQLCYNGLVDDVRLYARTLASDEVYSLWRGFCGNATDNDSDPTTPCTDVCALIDTPASCNASASGCGWCFTVCSKLSPLCNPGCPAGTTGTGFNSTTPCAPCGPGTYVPAGSVGPCQAFACPAGTTDNDSDASTACEQCPAGHWTAANTTGACTECAAGTTDDDHNASTDCGQVTDEQTCVVSTNCTWCPAQAACYAGACPAVGGAERAKDNSAVIGGAVGGGGAALLVVAGAALAAWVRRRQRLQYHDEVSAEEIAMGEVIGQGSFGVVYKATWRNTEVAAKVFSIEALLASDIAQFEKEVDVMRALRHPNILLFMCHAKNDTNFIIVTEYMPTGSLMELLGNDSVVVPLKLKLSILLDIARGMAYLHQNDPPILHRDLKSSNILLDSNLQAKVSDFAANILVNAKWDVKITDFGLSAIKNANKTMTVCGTVAWMSPEILEKGHFSEKSDVYAFGMVMYEIMTRHNPFNGIPIMSLPAGPILHWAFDGSNSTTGLADSSGNGLAATVAGTFSGNISWVPGIIGSRALQLRPSWTAKNGEMSQGIGCPYLVSPILRRKGIQGMAPFTLSLWAKPVLPVSFVSGMGAWLAVIGMYTYSYFANTPFMWEVMTTQQLKVGAYSGSYSFPSFREVAGEWMHLVTTYDGNMGGAQVSTYINGAIVDVHVSLLTPGDAAKLWIGYGTDSQLCYSGLIDDLRLYNRQLSPQEIYDLWRGQCNQSESKCNASLFGCDWCGKYCAIKAQCSCGQVTDEQTCVVSTNCTWCPAQAACYAGACPAVGGAERAKDNSAVIGGAYHDEVSAEEIAMGEVIGQGSFGVVYKATWRNTEVAAKVFSIEALLASDIAQFEKEVDVMRALRHPNILLFMCHAKNDTNFIIVTEYMPTGSLMELLGNDSVVVPLKLKLSILLDIARGMAYLHQNDPPILHRDLKSSNILLDSNLQAKLTPEDAAKLSCSLTLKVIGSYKLKGISDEEVISEAVLCDLNRSFDSVNRSVTSDNIVNIVDQPQAVCEADVKDMISQISAQDKQRPAWAINSSEVIISKVQIGRGNYGTVFKGVTEWMDGGSLRAIIDDKFVDFPKAVSILSYIHASRIIHRDLKAANILVNAKWDVKITGTYSHTLVIRFSSFLHWPNNELVDFGLSAIKNANKTMTVCGTVAWMSPEILEKGHFSEKSDVYAFGMVMYEIMTRHNPFNDVPVMSLVSLIINGERPPVPDNRKGYTANFVATMKQTWQQNPEQRPSFNDIGSALSPSGPILHWAFDGPNSTTGLADSSGNGLAATVAGTFSGNISWMPGIIGSHALELRPSWTEKNWEMSQGIGGMGAWLAAIGMYSYSYYSNTPFMWQIMTTQQLKVGAYQGAYTLPSFREVSGEWMHLVTTYGGNSGGAALSTYINGVLVDESVVWLTPGDAAKLFVGHGSDSQLCYSGLIDDLRLYNCQLSPQEIYDLWRGQCNQSEESYGPCEYYQCYDGQTSYERCNASLFGCDWCGKYCAIKAQCSCGQVTDEQTCVVSTNCTWCPAQAACYAGACPAVGGAERAKDNSAVIGGAYHDEVSAEEIVMGEVIGQGSFGVVYKATWRNTEVAAKVFSIEALLASDIAQFEKEVDVMRALRHPNILLFMCHAKNDTNFIIVTEYMPTGSLMELLGNDSVVVPLKLKLSILLDIARGMAYLHQNDPPILHRDLKSSNILLDSNLQAKVSDFDFGLSAIKNANKTMTVCGTVAWMSPEILEKGHFSEKSDVYAFGMVMYEIMTRHNPFNDVPVMSLVSLIINGERPPVPDNRKGYTANYVATMKQTWQHLPDDRPTFNEIGSALSVMT